MFDLLCIFTSGGLVLWYQGQAWAPLNVLITQVLMQERTSLSHYTKAPHILKWTKAPKYDLFFVAVYQQMFPLVMVEELLEKMKKTFTKALEKHQSPDPRGVPFEEYFQEIHQKWQEECQKTKRPSETPEINPEYLPAPRGDNQSSPESKKKEKAPKSKKPTKQARVWGIDNKVTKKKMQSLDKSKDKDNGSKKTQYLGGSSEDESEEEVQESGLISKIANRMKNFTGNKELKESDLAPVMKEFKDALISKNVAEEIADQLCSSVSSGLINTKTASFTSVHSTVKSALQSSLEKLLTPKNYVDVLGDALAAKRRGRPYVIAVCGVNGVGKSTSIAKVAYFLQSRGNLSIMIAACDTFRSGAVEQLRTHCNTLEIPLFDQGYGKDPGNVAKEAIKVAQQRNYDVVLVDTAGRMQHNESLMGILGNLVNVNKPDLVLFVGEALVGNDGVDQLVTFNRALTDKTIDGRGVDGVILTKFDTVDDKVGAALSMVYSTGKPIVFVGVGERYGHLKRLDVRMVTRLLLN